MDLKSMFTTMALKYLPKFPKEGIDLESITTDVNKLICDWLVEQGHPYLLTAD